MVLGFKFIFRFKFGGASIELYNGVVIMDQKTSCTSKPKSNLQNNKIRENIAKLKKNEHIPSYCYVMKAVVSVNCLQNKCLLHAKLMSTALTQLPIFRFSFLLTNKGIAQCIDNSN